MITKITIDGFKTFRGFEMEFSPLTVIAGVNASGKSNLFDALQLLSALAETELRLAFREQRGEPFELFMQYGGDRHADEMRFDVELLLNKEIRDNWGREATLKYTRLRYTLAIQRRKNGNGLEDLYVSYEHLSPLRQAEDTWNDRFIPQEYREFWRPKVFGGRAKDFIETSDRAIILRQDGKGGNKKEHPLGNITQTILSSVNSVDFKHAFAVKEELRSWKFLQLSPQALRAPTRKDIGLRDTITQSGENLAAAAYRIHTQDEFALKDISHRLNNLLPTLTDVSVVDDDANKQFLINVRNADGREFSSRVLSEGTLRLLTLCILLLLNYLEQKSEHPNQNVN